jgi:hypothetical protein
MTKLSITNALAAAATATVLTIAVSGSAFAHGGGMGGHMGANIGGTTLNTVGNTTKTTMTTRVTHDRRRFRFLPGSDYVSSAPACFYSWTSIGRVRICPDYN